MLHPPSPPTVIPTSNIKYIYCIQAMMEHSIQLLKMHGLKLATHGPMHQVMLMKCALNICFIPVADLEVTMLDLNYTLDGHFAMVR